MRLLLLVCSELSILDGRTNNFSAINIIEEINSAIFPFVAPKISVTGLISRDAQAESDEVALVLRLALDESQLVEQPINASFGGMQKVRTFLEFHGLIIPRPGLLRFSLHPSKERADSLGEWTINVRPIGNVSEPQFQISSPSSASS